MGAGDALRTELDAADDADLQPFDVKHLIGYKPETCRVGRKNIGTNVPEVREANQTLQGMGVELMIA